MHMFAASINKVLYMAVFYYLIIYSIRPLEHSLTGSFRKKNIQHSMPVCKGTILNKSIQFHLFTRVTTLAQQSQWFLYLLRLACRLYFSVVFITQYVNEKYQFRHELVNCGNCHLCIYNSSKLQPET